jgi:biopolymer transport protein ExbB/TolQ
LARSGICDEERNLLVNKISRIFEALMKSPILWGGAAGAAFFGLVHAGTLGPTFFQRYCAGHPVEYVETILFWMGLAVLLIKAMDLGRQFPILKQPMIASAPSGGQSVSEVESLLVQLKRSTGDRQDAYLVRRLRDGLEYIWRRGSAENLDEHLKYLSELDADRAHASYNLLRLIVWAIPILGFLGTVIGITMAIASLKPSSLEESMVEVTAGLGVAFDTTALALALSIILMFVQHYVDRAENTLLGEVDRRVDAELTGRFMQISAAAPDIQSVVFRKMSESLIASMEELVRRQAEVWQATLNASQTRWNFMAEDAGRQLQTAMSAALAENMKINNQQFNSVRGFEETGTNLIAAIHLLNAKIGSIAAGSPTPEQDPQRRKTRAA